MELRISSKFLKVILLSMTIIIVICITKVIFHAYSVIVTCNTKILQEDPVFSIDVDYQKALLFSDQTLPQYLQIHVIRKVYLTEVPSTHLRYNFDSDIYDGDDY